MSMNPTFPAVRLASLGTLVLSGADARDFLQGQLSADLAALTPQGVLLASCNSAQGRVQAVLWLVERSTAIVLILPAAMLETIAARLRKFVLRAKVKIEPGALSVAALAAHALPAQVPLPQAAAHCEHDGISYVRLPGHDAILLASAHPAATVDPSAELRWRRDDIRAGLPQVYPQTHEAFVAQMLNLDLLGGVSFQKGCYTGQEIIARTHYRGTIKRRMLRFTAACPPPLPGTRILAGEQHAADVVDAVPDNEGCELLAVASLTQADEPLHIEGLGSITLQRADLPYALS